MAGESSSRPNRAPIRSRRRTTTTRGRVLRAGSSLGLLLLVLCGCGGPHWARAQDAGTADDSVPSNATTTNATDDDSALCQQLWMASDSDQDGRISRSEYINWVIRYGPHSPGCPDQSLYVSQFLGDAPLLVAFDALACLCTASFDGGGGGTTNASCCEDDPHLLLPTNSQVPSSYAATVCHAIDQVLEDQCPSPNATATTTNDNSGNSGTPSSTSEAPEEGGGGETGWIPMNKNSTTTPTDGGGGGGTGGGNRRLVQVVLPLLLVAAAAVFMALTLVVYQRRKHASNGGMGGGFGRLGPSPSLSRSRGAADANKDNRRRRGGGDGTERADASSTSTDSDEEAPVACDADSASAVTAKASSSGRRRSSRDGSRRRSHPTSSTLIDVDTGAPVARRTAPKTSGTARRTAKSSSSSSNSRRRRKVHHSSLVDSVGRLEPLREVEEGLDEDDDDDATTSSGSDGAVALDASSSSEASEATPPEASPTSSSFLRHTVSFGDEDDDGNENDGDAGAEAAPGQPSSSLTSALLDPIGSLLQDLWTSHLPLSGPPPLSPNGAPGPGHSGVDAADVERPENCAEGAAGTGTRVVVEAPEAVIRRTKDNDESFDEVSL